MSLDLAREPVFRLGSVEVRPSTREVVAVGQRQVLEPRVMQVLVVLARRRGEVVSRDELIDACWAGRSVGEDAINRCIAAIRRLGEAHSAFRLETVPRVGYRLAEAVAETPKEGEHALPARSDGSADNSASRIPLRGPLLLWAVLGLLLAASLAILVFRDRLTPAPAPAALRVAVAPLDTGQDVAARGFADALLDRIVEVMTTEQVLTISRADSAGLGGPGAADQAAKLGAGLMLNGRVETDGKSFKIDLHLDDPRAHVTLWSKSFDARAQDDEGLQVRLADRVTAVAKWAVSPKLSGVWHDQQVVSDYLEARDEFTYEGGGRSLEIAREVVARAPGFAAGHELLAQADIGIGLPLSEPAIDEADAVADSAKEAKIALGLDPTDGFAYALLAWDTPLSAWRERSDWVEKGLRVAPTDPYLANVKSEFLLSMVGRNREAVEWKRRVVRGEPFFVGFVLGFAAQLAAAGDDEEATATALEARRYWPDYWETPYTEWAVAAIEGRYPRALELLDDPNVRKILESPPGNRAGAVDVTRTAIQGIVSGDPRRMQAAARAMAAAADRRVIDDRDAMAWLARLGDLDDAFRLAKRAFSPSKLAHASGLFFGSSGGTDFLFYPLTAPMRHDRRFMPLAARIGLVDYWRWSGHWPDFCSEPGLPYDCKVEAARVAGAAAGHP